jgi:hypothetical protein
MKYDGLLFGKIGRKYFPITTTREHEGLLRKKLEMSFMAGTKYVMSYEFAGMKRTVDTLMEHF